MYHWNVLCHLNIVFDRTIQVIFIIKLIQNKYITISIISIPSDAQFTIFYFFIQSSINIDILLYFIWLYYSTVGYCGG